MARPANRLSLMFNYDAEETPCALPQGIRLLMYAVIGRAILDLRPHKSTEIQQRAALRFINDDGDGPYSFNWLCDALGLSASATRQSIHDSLVINSVDQLKVVRRYSKRRYQVTKKIRESRTKKNKIVCSSFVENNQDAKSVFV